MPEPLSSPEAYQTFIYTLGELYPSIRQSTLVYIPSGDLFGRVEGILGFEQNIVLCVQEYLNFELGVIEGYGYEVSHPWTPPDSPDFPAASEYCRASYPQKDKRYWYDSFPHPQDPALAATEPHHKHVPPDIKHHRIPAPELTFTRPNLPFLIQEIEHLLKSQMPGVAVQ
jgi:hypothetical protein